MNCYKANKLTAIFLLIVVFGNAWMVGSSLQRVNFSGAGDHGLFDPSLVEDRKLVLLRCAQDFSTCDYRGAFLEGAEARRFQTHFDGFSAPALVTAAEKTYLIATPTEGCSTASFFRMSARSFESLPVR